MSPNLRALYMMAGLASSTVAVAQEPMPSCDVRGSQQWLSTRPSPLDSVAIIVAGKTAKICYSRPSARGRSVYDSLAPFGKAWRTGANEPTTLTLTGTFDVGGAVLPPGRYVVLTVPGAEQWSIVFNTTRHPEKMFLGLVEAGIGTARVERLDAPVEQFTIRATPSEAVPEFVMEWGSLRARLPVRAVP
jgi:Protein of unknown function (DUF2911)